MSAENITLYFDVRNTTTTTVGSNSAPEQVTPIIIGIIVLGGVAGIAALFVGILCCWKCRKQKRDQMVSRQRDLGLQNFLIFCCLTIIEIGLDIPQS